ncbi:cobalamin biosynthesis protein, partial [Chloroflexota bacterium]
MLFLALVIDITLGEPPNLIHPVAWMGKSISYLEKKGVGQSHLTQFIYGTVMTLFLVGLFTAAVFFILFYVKNLNMIAYVIIGSIFLKSTFSLKGLRKVALLVKSALMKDNLDEARYEIRSLVSRDSHDLSKPLLVSAAVESVAESSCDSFIAPLFYFLLFGVPGAVAYRMVNTIDSMVGYHGKYEFLGKFSSQLDDILNYIPARLSALLLVLASTFSGRGAQASWQVALNEHYKTESPNAGWTIAAVAGALNIQLEKVGQYKIG